MPTMKTKTAFSYWDHRIAPVFDTAQQLYVVETDRGGIVDQNQALLTEELPVQKALRLVEWNISTLVCGAISRPMYELVAAYGIRIIPFVAGELDEIIQAWQQNRLLQEAFAMPGCCGRRRGLRGSQNQTKEVSAMNGRGQGMGGGRGAGGGAGGGRGGRQGGRMGGPMAAGPGGTCICPACGLSVPHQVGTPCMQQKCPQCGAAMTRE